MIGRLTVEMQEQSDVPPIKRIGSLVRFVTATFFSKRSPCPASPKSSNRWQANDWPRSLARNDGSDPYAYEPTDPTVSRIAAVPADQLSNCMASAFNDGSDHDDQLGRAMSKPRRTTTSIPNATHGEALIVPKQP